MQLFIIHDWAAVIVKYILSKLYFPINCFVLCIIIKSKKHLTKEMSSFITVKTNKCVKTKEMEYIKT